MPKEQPPVEQPKNQADKQEPNKPITFRWILLGIIAVIIMWLLSSLWFK